MTSDSAKNLNEMDCYLFDRPAINHFITFLQTKARVVAPHKKGQASFAYEIVSNPQDVVLQYPRTIQPLKKYFLPPREDLLSFDLETNKFDHQPVEAAQCIYFGVHSYEMAGVDRLDYAFRKGNPESSYLTRRENSIFVGIVYEEDEYHLASSLGIDPRDLDGFSLFIDRMDDDYLIFAVDKKGADLLSEFGKAQPYKREASRPEDNAAKKIKLHYNRLPQVFGHVYKSKVWDSVSERCVGCGTCNLLCSTCYCFDVRDEIELDARSGQRTRFWDGCMLNSFAEVAGGENFREKLSNRTRHRLYRKFKYNTETSGLLHCVGCGRCSRYCPAGISIIEIINGLIDDYNQQQNKQMML